MMKWRSADPTTRRWCATCLNWLAKWNGSPGKRVSRPDALAPIASRLYGKRNSFRPRCCPPMVSATSPWTSRSASYPSPTWGETLSTSSAYRTVSSELPRRRGREGLVGSHVCRARDGNAARDSQVRDGYRAGFFPIERASGAATHQGPLLFDLLRSFQPCRARTHLLQCRDAIATAGLRKRVPATRRGWITFGNVPGFHLRTARRAACPRRLRSVCDRRSS
jgi:hypothetical protein